MNTTANTQNWTEAFEALLGYVAAHPELVVTRRSLTVPPDLRSEFYGLVSEVQLALAAKTLGNRKGKVLGGVRRCAQVRSELIKMSGLKEFRLASTLENLIADPEATLAKPAFGIVLDGLQQGFTPEEMEIQATRSVIPFCEDLFRNAYEAWAYYGIIAALKPIKFYGVYSPDTVEVQAVPIDFIKAGEQINSPERRMPEAVFQTQDGRIFAMKSEAATGLDFYGEKITRRRDNSAGGNTADLIAHRVLLLYKIDSVDKVPIIADRDKLFMLPSDLMCEFLLPNEMEQPSFVSLFVERINSVRSKRPVQVLTFDEKGKFPEGLLQDSTVAPVERKMLGFDSSSLKKIADLLVK